MASGSRTALAEAAHGLAAGAGAAVRTRLVGVLAAEAAIVAALTTVVACAYVWTHAPLYNLIRSVDPWLYTALWTNFDQIYHNLAGTYYVSRLPWIVPGYVLNAALGYRAAYFIVHTAFFLGGGVLFYALCRRWFGRLSAAVGYLALIGNQMYYNAHRWDYEEGGVLTFLIAAIAFSVPRTNSFRWRYTSFALAGFFSAAVVTTRILDTVYLAVGLPLLYVATVANGDRAARVRQFAFDFGFYLSGAALLLVSGGMFARANSESFFFFWPQVRTLFTASNEANHLPLNQWFPVDSYFIMPPFAVAIAAIALAFGTKELRTVRRLVAASATWTAILFVFFAVWQFAGSGWLFQLAFYFSSFLLPSLLCLVGAFRIMMAGRDSGAWWMIVLAPVAAAVVVPVLVIYRTDATSYISNGFGRGSYLTTIILMSCALALMIGWVVAQRRIARLALLVVLVGGLAFGGVAYGTAASLGTWYQAVSDGRTGDAYDLGQKMIAYLHRQGFKQELPYFWYRQTDTFEGLQSLYYYSYTFIGTTMPEMTADFMFRMHLYRPTRLVLMCSRPRCNGALARLARSAYRGHVVSRGLLRAGALRMWLVLYRLDRRPAPA